MTRKAAHPSAIPAARRLSTGYRLTAMAALVKATRRWNSAAADSRSALREVARS
jgi:hypothetical protein